MKQRKGKQGMGTNGEENGKMMRKESGSDDNELTSTWVCCNKILFIAYHYSHFI